MRRKKLFFIIPAAIIGIALFIFLGGWLVMSLWNWLLPPLFGWRLLTFWQAVAMLALCRILFGGVSGRGWSRSYSGRRVSERWGNMTPEEREKFRQGMRARIRRRMFEPPERYHPWPPNRNRHSARIPNACQNVIRCHPNSVGSSQFHSSITSPPPMKQNSAIPRIASGTTKINFHFLPMFSPS